VADGVVTDAGLPGQVLGLGTDLVEIDRFRLAMTRRGPRFAERLFSEAERAYADRHRDPAPRLAARFAAKEAVMKALGVGLWKFAFRDVEVVRAKSGAPSLALRGKAEQLAGARGVRAWQLSLSHTDSTAIAVALAIG
jgi:holo-[acyl-carrier protein] synthase